MKNNIKPRPALHTEAAGKIYPGAWKKIDNFRADRGIELPNWPDWCFAPLAAWYAIVCAETERQALDLQIIGDVSRLAALGAWRAHWHGFWTGPKNVVDSDNLVPVIRKINQNN